MKYLRAFIIRTRDREPWYWKSLRKARGSVFPRACRHPLARRDLHERTCPAAGRGHRVGEARPQAGHPHRWDAHALVHRADATRHRSGRLPGGGRRELGPAGRARSRHAARSAARDGVRPAERAVAVARRVVASVPDVRAAPGRALFTPPRPDHQGGRARIESGSSRIAGNG